MNYIIYYIYRIIKDYLIIINRVEYQAKPESDTVTLKGITAPQDVPDHRGGIEHREGGATQYFIQSPS